MITVGTKTDNIHVKKNKYKQQSPTFVHVFVYFFKMFTFLLQVVPALLLPFFSNNTG